MLAAPCRRLRLGQQLEQRAGAGVVVVDRRDDEESARTRAGAREQAQLVVQQCPPPIDRIGPARSVAQRQTPGLEQAAARPKVRPHAVLHARDHDGVELGAEGARRSQDLHDVHLRGRLQSVFRDVRFEDAAQEHGCRRAVGAFAVSLRGLEEFDDGIQFTTRLRGSGPRACRCAPPHTVAVGAVPRLPQQLVRRGAALPRRADTRERPRDLLGPPPLARVDQGELDGVREPRGEQLRAGRFGRRRRGELTRAAGTGRVDRRICGGEGCLAQRRAQAPHLDRVEAAAVQDIRDVVRRPSVDRAPGQQYPPQQVAYRGGFSERPALPRCAGRHLTRGEFGLERRHLTRVVGDDRAVAPRDAVVDVPLSQQAGDEIVLFGG
jgi:hypothetical protein